MTLSKKPMKRRMVLPAKVDKDDPYSLFKDLKWEDVPYTCTICQEEIETWEDLVHKRLPCGCHQEICRKCESERR